MFDIDSASMAATPASRSDLGASSALEPIPKLIPATMTSPSCTFLWKSGSIPAITPLMFPESMQSPNFHTLPLKIFFVTARTPWDRQFHPQSRWPQRSPDCPKKSVHLAYPCDRENFDCPTRYKLHPLPAKDEYRYRIRMQ